MKACERYLNAIDELVDGTLGPLRRAELELHLESCEDCRALVADLQKIVRVAASLEPLVPPDRVWGRIAGQLHQEGRVTTAPASRRGSYTVLALAAALLLAVGASLFVLLPRHSGTPAAPPVVTTVDPHPPAGNVDPDDPVQGIDSELVRAEQHFKNAVEEAQKTAGAVDPETVATMQKTLGVINDALKESREARKTDPQSAEASKSYYELLKQKIQFLQNTITLMNEMRQGDAAGAAQIVEGGKS
jgi:Putative zinc-finger